MKASALDRVAGVGPTRAKALIRHFGSLPALKEASVEQIARVPGIGDTTARAIHASLQGENGILDT